MRCRSCGTLWRVWPADRVARPAIERTRDHLPEQYDLIRTPRLGIDQIIETVAKSYPEIEVFQNFGTHVGDDDSLWFFRLPARQHNVQIESLYGDPPYLIEEDWKGYDNVMTIEAATRIILDHYGDHSARK